MYQNITQTVITHNGNGTADSRYSRSPLSGLS